MANSGGSFDPDSLVEQLQILNQKLEDPEIWKDHIKISKLNKEKTEKETKLSEFKGIDEKFNDINKIKFSESFTENQMTRKSFVQKFLQSVKSKMYRNK